LLPVFDNVQVDQRHVCMPPEWYAGERSFTERNALYRRCAVDLGAAAATDAMAAADVGPDEVGSIVFVSTTGLATPSLDVALARRLGLPGRHLHREAIFGRGCSGGAVGLAQAADRARLERDRAVLLVVVELCSLTFQRMDLSTANVVSTALFGDGAAAAVLDGREAQTGQRSGVSVLGHDSVTWPDTEDLMGWRFGDDGMTVTLAKSIPHLVRREFRATFEEACARVGVSPGDVDHHLVHPGSAVVLDAVGEALDLHRCALEPSREVLRQHGNMSAATVLFILDRCVNEGRARPGDVAVLSAMGPGFSADHVVLQW